MAKIIAAITMSVDGYITGPDDGPGKGLGEGGERLAPTFAKGVDAPPLAPEPPVIVALHDLGGVRYETRCPYRLDGERPGAVDELGAA